VSKVRALEAGLLGCCKRLVRLVLSQERPDDLCEPARLLASSGSAQARSIMTNTHATSIAAMMNMMIRTGSPMWDQMYSTVNSMMDP
jgi:hypothetical protein